MPYHWPCMLGLTLCQQQVTLCFPPFLLLEVEQDPVVLPPAGPPPAFSQSISLIREMRDYRNKGKQSKKTK